MNKIVILLLLYLTGCMELIPPIDVFSGFPRGV